jgi:hypothetical protein
MKRVISLLLTLAIALTALPINVAAVNPYLPLWEHLPDGEPRVFEDPDNPGQYRVYIIGSHDVRFSTYCGPDIRIWSASVDDLENWRDEGVVFSYQSPTTGMWDTMYAPDLVEVMRRDNNGNRTIREYYLYPHSRGPGREAMVAKSVTGRPEGPYQPINVNENGTLHAGSTMGFDPSVYIQYIDDPRDPDYEIGFRAYGYYGFQRIYAVELDQNTMYSVRPGTSRINYFIPSSSSYGVIRDPAGTTYPHVIAGEDLSSFNFFEAASVRRYEQNGRSIYIWVFSGYSGPDYGLSSTNSALRYCYGDSPLGPWRSGGVLVDSRAVVPNENGTALTTTYSGHNTHGSIELINGQWYAFYHRAPRGHAGSRQPMVAPITIDWDGRSVANGGRLSIRGYDPFARDGIWTARGGSHVYTGAEVTSEGFQIYGLDPYRYYSAGIASYLSNSQVQADAWDIWNNHAPITNVRNGNIIGYNYFGFGRANESNTMFNLWYTPQTSEAATIEVWLDGPWANSTWNGTKIGEIAIPANSANELTHSSIRVSSFVDNLTEKNAIFLFVRGGSGNLVDITGLGFSSDAISIAPPDVPTVSIQVDGRNIELPATPVRSTEANGITDYTVYEVEVTRPFNSASPPVVTASVNGDAEVISIEQITTAFGTAVVKFDLTEPSENYISEKTYNIIFTSDATYSISADSVSFGVLSPSYAQPREQVVTITNTGTGQITLEQPTSTNFEIGALSNTILNGRGDTASFTIRPNASLALGDYSAVIQTVGRASGDGSDNRRVTANVGVGLRVGDASAVITITQQPVNTNGVLSVEATVGWVNGERGTVVPLRTVPLSTDPCGNDIEIAVTPYNFNGASIPTSGFVNGQSYTVKYDVTTTAGSNGGFRLRYSDADGIHHDDAAHSTNDATTSNGIASQIPALFSGGTISAGQSRILTVTFEAGLSVAGQQGGLANIGLYGLYGEDMYTVNAVQVISNETGNVIGFFANNDYNGELTDCTCVGGASETELPVLMYQWYSDNTPIPGANGADFTPAGSAGTHNYFVIVNANGAVSVTSDTIAVTVNDDAPVNTTAETNAPEGSTGSAVRIVAITAIAVIAGVVTFLIRRKRMR